MSIEKERTENGGRNGCMAFDLFVYTSKLFLNFICARENLLYNGINYYLNRNFVSQLSC